MGNPQSRTVRELRNGSFADWRSRGAIGTSEASAVLGLHPEKIRSMLASGQLTRVATGDRRLRVSVASIKKLLGES